MQLTILYNLAIMRVNVINLNLFHPILNTPTISSSEIAVDLTLAVVLVNDKRATFQKKCFDDIITLKHAIKFAKFGLKLNCSSISFER